MLQSILGSFHAQNASNPVSAKFSSSINMKELTHETLPLWPPTVYATLLAYAYFKKPIGNMCKGIVMRHNEIYDSDKQIPFGHSQFLEVT